MNQFRVLRFGASLAVAAVTLWLFWPASGGQFLTRMDDDEYLRRAEEYGGLSMAALKWAFTTTEPYYQPLPRLSHVAVYQVFGANPRAHHLVNVWLHAVNAGLLVCFAEALLAVAGWQAGGRRLSTAVGTGLVFGIHPLQVESVAWLAGRTTLLCTFFFVACLWAYMRGTRSAHGRAWRWATGVLFVGALLAKPMAISIPFVMLAMDYYPLNRYRQAGWRPLLKEKVLLLGMVAGATFLTILMESRARLLVGTQWIGPVQRLLLACRSLVFYLWKTLWPAWLSPFYPFGTGVSWAHKEFAFSVVVVALVTWICWRYRTRHPEGLAAWAAYLALVLPSSGLVQAGSQTVASRYAYLAMVPLVTVIMAGLAMAWRRVAVLGRSVLAVLLGLYALFLGSRTRAEIPVWHDDITLWTTALSYFPDSDVARHMLGYGYCELAMKLVEQQHFDEALPQVMRGLELSPAYSLGHATLGVIYLKTKRYREAVMCLQQALHLEPTLGAARYNLACAYARLGKPAEACATLSELLKRQPRYAALAVRDAELAPLRNDPEYARRFDELLAAARR
ncbi:MAG TPA: tetratricopeptide repeat protein [Verrucomicrobiae bacterium]|nr:tetratricopeptide repeat protein [Verrucomicrobiae bacterium]